MDCTETFKKPKPNRYQITVQNIIRIMIMNDSYPTAGNKVPVSCFPVALSNLNKPGLRFKTMTTK